MYEQAMTWYPIMNIIDLVYMFYIVGNSSIYIYNFNCVYYYICVPKLSFRSFSISGSILMRLIICTLIYLNSLRPSDAYMRQ